MVANMTLSKGLGMAAKYVRNWAIVTCVMVTVWVSATVIGGCSAAQNRQFGRDALSWADIACILASQLTDAPAVMTACRVKSVLRPAVDELLAGKAAAQRAGVCR